MANLATISNNILADSGIDPIDLIVGTGTVDYIAKFTAEGAIGNSIMSQSGSNILINGNITLHAGNYNSYAPTLTGGGASGTWGISITGNADTVDGYHANNAANGLPTLSSNAYWYAPAWINVDYGGIFSSINSAHLRPNAYTYGSWSVSGSRNGYNGFEFDGLVNGNVALMIGTSSNVSGFYNTSYGWQFYWNGGTMYVYKNTYGGGTQATVWDSVNAPTSTSATPNTLALRTVDGDVAVRELIMNVGVQDFIPSSMVAIYPTTNQAVKVTASGARSFLNVPTRTGGDASGTWGINITGNAAYASSAGNADTVDGYHASAFALVNGNTGQSFGVFELTYAQTQFNPSLAPRTGLNPMSIKMWDNYFAGIGLGVDYGVVMDYYGRSGHVQSQVYFDAGGGSWYRIAHYASGWASWQKYVTENGGTWNISISGGSATSLLLSASGSLLTQYGSGTIGYSYALTAGTSGLFSASDNSNAIITVNRHPGDYYSQLGFSSNGEIYYRRFSAAAINTSLPWVTLLTSNNYNSYAPTLTGGGASGTWNINISGSASSETLATVVARGNTTGGGRPITLDTGGGAIITQANGGGWSMGSYYKGSAGTYLAGFGAYGGNDSLSYAWIGVGYDSSWLQINPSSANFQVPLQQGGNQVLHAGNYTSYAVQTTGQSNWNSYSVIGNVVGLLAWKNYGNGHVIFDASQGTSPSGTSINNTNPTSAWAATYPTLMGWNGTQTYGVRVDSARVADSAGSVDFNSLTNKTGGTGTYQTSGDFRAPVFYDSNDTSYYLNPNGQSVLYSAQFNAVESINLYGVRGRFTNEYIHLYQKVGVGDPNGWGAGETSTPGFGLSTYGGANFAYGNGALSTFNGQVNIKGSSMYVTPSQLHIGQQSSGTAQMSFESWGSYTGAIAMNSAGQFHWGGQAASSWYWKTYCTYNGDYSTSGNVIMSLGSGGSLFAAGDMRAPIFYDSQDINYYVDPNNQSNLRAIMIDGYVQYGTSSCVPSSNYGNGRVYLRVWPTASGARIMSFKISISSTWNYAPAFGYITADVSFYYDGSGFYNATTTITSATGSARGSLGIGQPVLENGYVSIPVYSVNTNCIFTKIEGTPSFDWGLVGWSAWESVSFPGAAVVNAPGDMTVGGTLTGSGNITSSSAMYAPIYYDYNNSAYYLDPSNFSNLYSATFNSTVNLQTTNWFGGYGPGSGPGIGLENLGSFARFAFWGLDFYDWNDGIQMTLNSGYVSVNNYLQAGNSLRAPIFYDSNDTSYYLDPNGNSNLYTTLQYEAKARKPQSDNNYTTAAIWTESYSNTTTGIAFHISGVAGKFLEMRTNGVLYWENNPVITSGNYNSYSPTLTGGGASGTWGINITGSATNAVSLTTNYAGGQQLNPQVYFNGGIGVKVAMTAAAGIWSDTLWINGYNGGDVLSMCALHTQRNGTPRMYISTQNSNATSYGALYQFLTEYNWTDYAPTKTGGGASGTWGINITGSSNSSTYSAYLSDNNASVSDGFVAWNSYDDTTNNPGNSWWYGMRVSHGDALSYYSLTISSSFFSNDVYYRRIQGGTAAPWIKFLDANNYNSYAPTLTGTGASGTWAISITGSSNYVTHYSGRTDGTWYNAVWATGNPSHMYSCDAVQILSSAGALRANLYYGNQNTTYFLSPAGGSSYLRGRVSVTGGHGDSSLRVFLRADENGSNAGQATLEMWVSEPGVSWNWAGFGYNVTNDNGSPGGFGRINTSFGQAYMRFSDGGDLYFYNTNTSGTRVQTASFGNGGSVTFGYSVTASSFFESSDMRIKELIEDNYKADGIESITARLYKKNGKIEVGYYAQDVQDILPSAVSVKEDGYLNLSYREVHTAKIAYLENKIKQLEEKLNSLY